MRLNARARSPISSFRFVGKGSVNEPSARSRVARESRRSARVIRNARNPVAARAAPRLPTRAHTTAFQVRPASAPASAWARRRAALVAAMSLTTLASA